jgi:hypothetical protein
MSAQDFKEAYGEDRLGVIARYCDQHEKDKDYYISLVGSIFKASHDLLVGHIKGSAGEMLTKQVCEMIDKRLLPPGMKLTEIFSSCRKMTFGMPADKQAFDPNKFTEQLERWSSAPEDTTSAKEYENLLKQFEHAWAETTAVKAAAPAAAPATAPESLTAFKSVTYSRTASEAAADGKLVHKRDGEDVGEPVKVEEVTGIVSALINKINAEHLTTPVLIAEFNGKDRNFVLAKANQLKALKLFFELTNAPYEIIE